MNADDEMRRITEFSEDLVRKDFNSPQRRLMVGIGSTIMEIYVPIMLAAKTNKEREKVLDEIIECLAQSMVMQQNIYKFAKEISKE